MKQEETENLELQYVTSPNYYFTDKQYQRLCYRIIWKSTEILHIYEKNPILQANHHSKNGVIIFDKTVTALLNADKNNKITKLSNKNIENLTNHTINTWKKIKIYPTKIFIVKIVQENHFQITSITLDNNHPIIQIIEDDHHTKKNYEISHKTDTVDHIVEILNIKITIQDQIHTNLNFRLIPVPIQTLEIKIIQTTDLETLHTIDIEIFPTIGIETIQSIEIRDIKIIDYAIILTTDQSIKFIKIDHATIHKTEIQAITIDKGTTLNQHIEITHVIKIHHKIIVVVHLNIKDK